MEEYQDSKAKLPSFGPGLDDQVAKYVQCAEITSLRWLNGCLRLAPESAMETDVANLDKLALA
ncbi:hypothetical protein B0J17DRAFT_721322 [Rhizoctonia solani]|nr:hypothetical protein B0J17DRAFT_721322 [Rhizoctonia solani]